MKRETGMGARAWKGMDAGYVAKHLWIVKHYGKADHCENPFCKSINPKRYEWANISGNYEREREDYRMLCPSCHRSMDYGNTCKRGHEFTVKNTRTTKEGWRMCRKCQALANREYRLRKKQIA